MIDGEALLLASGISAGLGRSARVAFCVNLCRKWGGILVISMSDLSSFWGLELEVFDSVTEAGEIGAPAVGASICPSLPDAGAFGVCLSLNCGGL